MARTLLRDIFAAFLRTRHFMRHFQRRLFLHDVATQIGTDRTVPQELVMVLKHAATANETELLLALGSSLQGLDADKADAVRQQVGLNEIEQEKPLSWWNHLWHCYRNPFNVLLSLLSLVSWLTDDIKAAVVILSMVLLSTLLRFWQEAKSNKEADSLKAMVSNTATVMRPGARPTDDEPTTASKAVQKSPATVAACHFIELPIKQLVPGDLILLSAGDMIPADCRLLSAKDLFVSQAAMTGESLPVEKYVLQRDKNAVNPLDLENIVFMGTNVVSGAATAVILRTGNATYFGALASKMTAQIRVTTAFQTGVNHVSWLLVRFMLVMVPVVLFINGFTKGDWFQALMFAMSIAIGLTPEMLPMIVTSTLAKGAVFLSRKKVVVKRLDAIQNFGAMDVLCTDKTGTLTQDRIILARHLDVWGGDSDEVLEMAYLNSYYQTGLKNLLDVAVLQHVEVHRELQVTSVYRKVDEIPFDFTRRRMSVVVAEKVAEKNDLHVLITKGAVEEILAVCSRVRHGEASEQMTPELLQRMRAVTAELNEDGLRVVAVASKELPPSQETYGIADERDLVLIGYVAFLDPPKESTEPALKALAEHGIALKVLTGDNELVTAKICRDVGLVSQGGILLGSDIERMNDKELATAVEHYNIFAKLTPAHKELIVRRLKANGHVVGFMGDGINDAPALRTADIGISVDSGVDIAKEAADIILLQKSLMVLEEGVLEGRRTFANMLKYIKMTASSNFGNVFSVLAASAFIPFLPMLPMHLLVQNLLYDISQIAIPFDNVDDELLKRPQRWNPADIGRFMVFFGPISSIFDITTFAMMWFVFGANTPSQQTLFQSGWFIVGLLTQTLIVHMIRTPKIPFIESRAAPPLMVMTISIMAAGIFLPMGPFADYFKLQALPPLYFVLLPLIVLGYISLTTLMKGYYVRRFGWQ
ncbi:MAG TPA: magnesium-translocating P-type ATPase [Candidatus Acidoferrum sp.]|nr:magnesium-translocating P-type ATPase [Candidatus Acidoferrum sp.]